MWDVAPFSTHYNKAESYKEFIHSAFDNGIELTIENHLGISGKVINTYTNEEDATYKKNGYNLIVDTRPSDTLTMKSILNLISKRKKNINLR